MSEPRLHTLRVECTLSEAGEEMPRRFYLGERGVDVLEILDRWIATDHHYFKLRGADGGVYILRYDVLANCWELTFYDSGTRDDTRLSST